MSNIASIGTSGPEIVEMVTPPAPQGALWAPVAGEEVTNLLQILPDDSRARVRDEAADTLSRCVPTAQASGSRTGLVIGYVQSGKTMSFTTLTAMACDNGIPIVIVVAGTSVPLSTQSEARLLRDLRLESRSDRKWIHFHNPRTTRRRQIADILADWRDQSVPPAERQTVLITVMKQHTHLRPLRNLLGALELNGLPALVVDDEADQASLNTEVNAGGQSTTYGLLLDLRGALPQHTFLQYTATPQAPLLINIIDTLSPDFAQVLTPGDDYVGGRDFFLLHPELVRVISPREIPSPNNPLQETPESLLEAMRFYFLGVASAYAQGSAQGNRSMLVHPSQRTLMHGRYHERVQATKDLWHALLSRAENDPDRQELVEDFRPAYDELRVTVPDLPEFSSLMGQMARAIRRTQVEEINARQGRTTEIVWRNSYSWILVGGQAMDRGFTIEGLTVTYMPRGAGVGNADTIQQRARFFGYKRPYLGYCRVYLESAVRDAYRHYVEHEENIRDQMQRWGELGRPLSEWRRAFFLDRRLKPTRDSVLDLDYIQGSFSTDWFTPRSPHDDEEVTAQNRATVAAFLSRLTLHPDEGHPDRTESQRHLIARDVSLQDAYTELLTQFRLQRSSDLNRLLGLCLQVERYLDSHPDARCTVVHINGGAMRERGLNEEGEVAQLFQGAAPVEPRNRRGEVYPGDRDIRAPHGVTIQIHTLRLRQNGTNIADSVPTIGVFASEALERGWLVQRESSAAVANAPQDSSTNSPVAGGV